LNNTLANGLQLLAFLSATAEAHSVTGIAGALGLPKSHVHRLLQTLVGLGYAEQDPDRRYRIGLEPLAVSKALLANHPLRIAAMPHLYRLAEATGMDASVTVPGRGEGIILASAFPQGIQGDAANSVGNRLRFPETATAALFAVFVPGFADPGVLAAERRAGIQRERLALRDPEKTTTHNGMATPVCTPAGEVIGALGLSAPVERFVPRYPRGRELLLSIVLEVERDLALQASPLNSSTRRTP
jgi:DNA-binding IclR family transcriptional regulator